MRRLSAAFTIVAVLAGPAWADPPGSEILQTLDQAIHHLRLVAFGERAERDGPQRRVEEP